MAVLDGEDRTRIKQVLELYRTSADSIKDDVNAMKTAQDMAVDLIGYVFERRSFYMSMLRPGDITPHVRYNALFSMLNLMRTKALDAGTDYHDIIDIYRETMDMVGGEGDAE